MYCLFLLYMDRPMASFQNHRHENDHHQHSTHSTLSPPLMNIWFALSGQCFQHAVINTARPGYSGLGLALFEVISMDGCLHSSVCRISRWTRSWQSRLRSGWPRSIFKWSFRHAGEGDFHFLQWNIYVCLHLKNSEKERGVEVSLPDRPGDKFAPVWDATLSRIARIGGMDCEFWASTSCCCFFLLETAFSWICGSQVFFVYTYWSSANCCCCFLLETAFSWICDSQVFFVYTYAHVRCCYVSASAGLGNKACV